MARNNKINSSANSVALLVATLSWQGIAAADQAPARPATNDSVLQLQNLVIAEQAPESQQSTGYQVQNSTAGTKTSTPLSETPRSVSVVTRQRIQDQGS